MSRTYVHEPNWVKARRPRWRRFWAEDHNHGGGAPCDLSAWLAARQAPWDSSRCHRLVWNIGRNVSCGCKLCTGQLHRKHTERARRTAWRADRARLLRDPQAEPRQVPDRYLAFRLSQPDRRRPDLD